MLFACDGSSEVVKPESHRYDFGPCTQLCEVCPSKQAAPDAPAQVETEPAATRHEEISDSAAAAAAAAAEKEEAAAEPEEQEEDQQQQQETEREQETGGLMVQEMAVPLQPPPQQEGVDEDERKAAVEDEKKGEGGEEGTRDGEERQQRFRDRVEADVVVKAAETEKALETKMEVEEFGVELEAEKVEHEDRAQRENEAETGGGVGEDIQRGLEQNELEEHAKEHAAHQEPQQATVTAQDGDEELQEDDKGQPQDTASERGMAHQDLEEETLQVGEAEAKRKLSAEFSAEEESQSSSTIEQCEDQMVACTDAHGGLDAMPRAKRINKEAVLSEDDVRKWPVERVVQWLCGEVDARVTVGKSDSSVVDLFLEHEIDGDTLLDLTESDLKDEFGIMAVGKRRRIVKAIKTIRNEPTTWSTASVNRAREQSARATAEEEANAAAQEARESEKQALSAPFEVERPRYILVRTNGDADEHAVIHLPGPHTHHTELIIGRKPGQRQFGLRLVSAPDDFRMRPILCDCKTGWNQKLGRSEVPSELGCFPFAWDWLSRHHASLEYDHTLQAIVVRNKSSIAKRGFPTCFVNSVAVPYDVAQPLEEGDMISLRQGGPAVARHNMPSQKVDFTFGLVRDCLTLDEALVSRKHAVIEYDHESDTFTVKDLGSCNGVFANRRKLAERTTTPIAVGTELVFAGPQNFAVGARLRKLGPTVAAFRLSTAHGGGQHAPPFVGFRALDASATVAATQTLCTGS